jgi:hypothetical protein
MKENDKISEENNASEITKPRTGRRYYLDIETVPHEPFINYPKASFEPMMAKIISIQYQPLDFMTGQPIGELQILKEWENGSSERIIVEKFKRLFLDSGNWGFVPVGNNLIHEFRFLKYKFNYYCGLNELKLGQRPMIDIKSTLIINNGGYFKGCARAIGKIGKAANIASWYTGRHYQLIEQYIIEEATNFVHAYSILIDELPKLDLTPEVVVGVYY